VGVNGRGRIVTSDFSFIEMYCHPGYIDYLYQIFIIRLLVTATELR